MDLVVARGNKQFQNGCQTWNREKLTDAAQSIQEIEFLVAMGNNWFQDGCTKHENREDASPKAHHRQQEIEFMK